MIAAALILVSFSSFAVVVEGVTLTNTLAGAIAPILTALLFIPVRRLFGKLEENHEVTKREAAELRVKLAEAEGAIRGDLKDGISTRLETIDSKLDAQDVATGKREEV
ncbi:MAG TPA: hypothetical protein VHU24_03165 [Solirubrobacterales bacterium]|jgi:membrane protein implicated in regulation of membrane protease activity|nr:hypothetical protein [Solirubrobacterales bacterium]